MGGLTVYTAVFGDAYHTFLDGWLEAAMQVGADEIVVVSDRRRTVPEGVRLIEHESRWRWREAGFRQHAVEQASGEWLWLFDVDDIPLPGIADVIDVDAEVVQVGYRRTDGVTNIPQVVPNHQYLRERVNRYVGTSPVRASAMRQVRGWPDAGFADWVLWRRLARAGARFVSAERICFEYRWHPESSLTGLKRNRQDLVEEALAL